MGAPFFIYLIHKTMIGLDIKYKFKGILLTAEVMDSIISNKGNISGSYPVTQYIVRHGDGAADIIRPEQIEHILEP